MPPDVIADCLHRVNIAHARRCAWWTCARSVVAARGPTSGDDGEEGTGIPCLCDALVSMLLSGEIDISSFDRLAKEIT